MTPRLAIFSLTRDRIEYTQACFEKLWETNPNMPEHLVIDNGSQDGTQQWLSEECARRPFLQRIQNDQNVGIARGTEQAVAFWNRTNPRPDVLIKIDNDCLVKTPDILRKIQGIYAALMEHPGNTQFILSPRVQGINKQPKRDGGCRVLNYTIGWTGIVGGLFQCVPFEFYQRFRFPENMEPAYGQDDLLCDSWRQLGGRNGYIEELEVEHYETTDGQAQRYPWYFRRRIEENPRHA